MIHVQASLLKTEYRAEGGTCATQRPLSKLEGKTVFVCIFLLCKYSSPKFIFNGSDLGNKLKCLQIKQAL